MNRLVMGTSNHRRKRPECKADGAERARHIKSIGEVRAPLRRSNRAAQQIIRGTLMLGVALLLSGSVTVALAAERDVLKPRVPQGRLDEAKSLKNPIAPTSASVNIGEGVFRGRGSCNVCHGEAGTGDGIGASGLDPSPRNFTNQKWQAARTDGELMYIFKHGIPGTAMITVVPGLVSEEQAWHLVNFIRSLNKK